MNQIIIRKDAIEQGLTHYYTGKPCKHGHTSIRRTDSGACCECVREYQKEYEQRPERKEANRLIQQKYAATERGKATERRKYERNPHRVIPKVISRKYPNAIVPLTDEELARTEGIYRFAAALRKRTGRRSWHVDHCYPLSLGGVHHPANLAILPAAQNSKKNNKVDPTDYLQWKGLLVSVGRYGTCSHNRDEALFIKPRQQ